MGLDPSIRSRLTLPAVCAPMTAVSGPELVAEACKAGIIGALPPQNASRTEEFEGWMVQISEDLKRYANEHPEARIGPLAINLSSRKAPAEQIKDMKICAEHGVKIFITAMGDPTEVAKRVHDYGGVIWHDVTSLKHAEKAMAAGVDGMTCIGAGGGGHSGAMSHLVLVPKVRAMFSGTVILAGAVSTGAVIRAAEILGADLAYLGTRMIATKEARCDERYKQILAADTSRDLIFTPKVSGVPANWLRSSLKLHGLDPDTMTPSKGVGDYSHLPQGITPWRDIWSGGQGLDLIDDVPTVAELVRRLRKEYIAACAIPDMAEAARVVDQRRAPAAG
ncbi:MAG: Nitronate monooxygenase [Phenylobacterium sp.]|nr:Nitronate monooxygenase [Phenylobacterium sp.]